MVGEQLAAMLIRRSTGVWCNWQHESFWFSYPRFDPLHPNHTGSGRSRQPGGSVGQRSLARSSRGLGHHPLKVAARVRIPYGLLREPRREALREEGLFPFRSAGRGLDDVTTSGYRRACRRGVTQRVERGRPGAARARIRLRRQQRGRCPEPGGARGTRRSPWPLSGSSRPVRTPRHWLRRFRRGRRTAPRFRRDQPDRRRHQETGYRGTRRAPPATYRVLAPERGPSRPAARRSRPE